MGARGPSPGTGAGRPRKPLEEKVAEGNRGHRPMEIIDFGNKTPDLNGVTMPKPSEYLSAPQKDGSELYATEIYEKTWNWIAERGCASMVSPQLIERYAMACARWIQCETVTSQLGFLAKHPTTGAAIASPYISIGEKYMSLANRLWSEIFAIIRENNLGEFKGETPQDDVMEKLLNSRKGVG